MRPNAATGYPGRTYKFYVGPTLWPFGYGLSLTTFALAPSRGFSQSPLRVSVAELLVASPPRVAFAVSVHNTGSAAGDEVVMLFVRRSIGGGASTYGGRRLVSFERAHARPGDRRTVTFEVELQDALHETNEERARHVTVT